ncbi:MAG: hypothetical protein QXE25_04340 [Nitrososphaerota archaeon]
MSWRRRVRLVGLTNYPPLLQLADGENILEVLEEPDEPVTTRFGARLPLIVRRLGEYSRHTWLIRFEEEVGSKSLLWQLREIAERHGGLRGLRLRVMVTGSGSARRYQVSVLGSASSSSGGGSSVEKRRSGKAED